MDMLNMDIRVFTKTKLDHDKYTPLQFGYTMLATKAISHSQGGVALFWRCNATTFHIEDPYQVLPNTIAATLVSGHNKWLLIGTYLAPDVDPTPMIDDMNVMTAKHPTCPTIKLGDFNANIQHPTTPQDIEITTLFAQLHLHLLHKFKQRNTQKHTWHQKVINCHTTRSQCDYIMTPTQQHINKAHISHNAPFASDHHALWITFDVAEAATHRQIAWRQSTIPKIPPTSTSKVTGNMKLNTLLEHKEKPAGLLPLDAQHRSWISQDTWITIDKRHTVRLQNGPAPGLITLRHKITRKLNRDCKDHMEKVGKTIDTHLRARDYQQAWRTLQPYYRKQLRIFIPGQEAIQHIGLEFQELYQTKTPPQGDPLQGTKRFEITNDIPDEVEIAAALGYLCTGKSPGPSGICSKDLQKWYAERKDNPIPWLTILDMVQAAFVSGELPTLLHCNILVLIPKAEPGKVHGIGLLESLWKLITTIIHCHLMRGITFHPDMHRFLPKKGCSTACMEAKLQMQHMYCIGQPLYQIFIDVSKAYDGLDRDRTLQLLQDYGVGENILWILQNFWVTHTIIP